MEVTPLSLELKIPEAENYFVIPASSNLRWLMMFYALPRELVEKRASYLKLPRNMRPIMNSEEYWNMINNDAFLELIWDCYAWQLGSTSLFPARMASTSPFPATGGTTPATSPSGELRTRWCTISSRSWRNAPTGRCSGFSI